MVWEYKLKAWVTTQSIYEIGTRSKTLGCQGREVEFLENVRHFALTVNNSQGSLLDNFQPD